MSDRLALALAELVAALRAELVDARPDPGGPDRLLSVDEAAAQLGIGRSMLYDLIAAQRIRSIRVGRRRLLASGAITDYIAGARP